MSMQDDEVETYYVPGSPMALIIIGAVLAAVGTAVLVAAGATDRHHRGRSGVRPAASRVAHGARLIGSEHKE